MEKMYSVSERFSLIDEDLRKTFVLQQVSIQILCAFIVKTGHKDTFVEYIKNTSLTPDETTEKEVEHAREVILKMLKTSKI